MVKILIVYDSESGNTEKMANAIAEGARSVNGVFAEVKKTSITTMENLLSSDGIVMGSPTYYGQMSAKLKALIDDSVQLHGKLEGKVGAAFTSAGGVTTGAETALLSILCAMLIHGMVIPGRSGDKHYGAFAEGEPNEEVLGSCRDLGRLVASLAVKLSK